MSTLDFFQAQLTESDFDRKLMFTTGDHDVGAGYHVTELKFADVKGIDCGANQTAWAESTIQLLDGHGGQHMRVGKFAKIVDQSVRAIPGLGAAPLRVEYGPGNRGLQLYRIGAVQRTDDALLVTLLSDQAQCKPVAVADAEEGCCATRSACC